MRKRSMSDFEELETFLQIVATGSFSGAARALRIPRSTVSRRLGALEERLGLPLVIRSTRSVRITAEGHRYAAEARPHLQAVKDLEQSLRDGEENPAGTVRAAYPPGAAASFFATFMGMLRDSFPKIRLELQASSSSRDAFSSGADLIVLQGPLGDSNWYARRLMSGRRILVAAPEYLEGAGPLSKPEDLAHHETLFHAQQSHDRPVWPGGNASPIPLRPLIHTTDAALVHQGTVAGLGIALLPELFVQEDLAAGRLRQVLPAIGDDHPFYILCERPNPVARIRAVRDLMLEFAGAIDIAPMD